MNNRVDEFHFFFDIFFFDLFDVGLQELLARAAQVVDFSQFARAGKQKKISQKLYNTKIQIFIFIIFSLKLKYL